MNVEEINNDQIRKTQRSGREGEPERRSGGDLEFGFPEDPGIRSYEKLFSANSAGDENETGFTTSREDVSKCCCEKLILLMAQHCFLNSVFPGASPQQSFASEAEITT